MNMLKKLRNRLLILLTTVIALVLLIAFAVVYLSTDTNVQQEQGKRLDELASLPLAPSTNNETFAGSSTINFAQAFILYVDNNGRLVGKLSYLDMSDSEYQTVLKNTWNPHKLKGTIAIEGRIWQYCITNIENVDKTGIGGKPLPNPENLNYKISFIDITNSSQSLTQLFKTFSIVWVIIVGVVFLLSLCFANLSIRPIEESIKKQKQFIADASHELKTPLAIISANMDAIEASGEETVNSQKEWISYIRSEVSRMGKLVGDLLYLAKAEDAKENLITFDLSIVCETAVASMEAIMYEKNRHLSMGIEKDVSVRGDMERIKQAVLILLDNAAKYTDENGDIHVTLQKLKQHAIFRVKNTGKGIPPEDVPRIFDRFYRPDSSRSKDSGGFGLGLSIAKSIVERAGGKISAQSNLGLTTFSITLKSE
ncbi:histidine kinase [Ktedonobacteria bacterium brp13]|nr:histidine kinase [Ktedonobacteria bacterium brp13]